MSVSKEAAPDIKPIRKEVNVLMRFALPKVSIALLALACACAMGAVPAQAYTHTAGPVWTVNGAKLGAGESHEVLSASSSGGYSMTVGGSFALAITCKKQAVENASITGGIPSTIKATFKLSECGVTGNGSSCKVKEPIVTKPLTGEIGYATKERTGKVLTRFEGSKGKLMEVKFEGACTFAEFSTLGTVIAEVSSGGTAEEVGKEASAKVDQLRFPSKPINAVWVENEARELEEKTATLTMGGEKGEIAGTSELELSKLPEWGIAAKHAVQGPFWVTKGAKLESGESHEVLLASSSGEYSISVGPVSHYDYTITCKKQKIEKASITGGILSTIKASFGFSECAVKGNGSGCTVPEPLLTEPLTGELGYATNEGTGKVLARFEGSGGHFIEGEFGGSCTSKDLEFDGALVAEIVSEGKVAEVEKPHEAKVEQLRFPETPIEKVWVENEKGELKEKTASMHDVGERVGVAGTSELELVSLSEWGVET